jgi:hypothetical protein
MSYQFIVDISPPPIGFPRWNYYSHSSFFPCAFPQRGEKQVSKVNINHNAATITFPLRQAFAVHFRMIQNSRRSSLLSPDIRRKCVAVILSRKWGLEGWRRIWNDITVWLRARLSARRHSVEITAPSRDYPIVFDDFTRARASAN